MPGVFISWCCSNKWAKRRWLQTTETYFLTVMKARNQKSRLQKSHAPFKGSKEEFFHTFLSSGGYSQSLVFFGSIIPISIYVSKCPFFSVSLCPQSPCLIRTSVKLNLEFILNWLNLQRSYFSIAPQLQIPKWVVLLKMLLNMSHLKRWKFVFPLHKRSQGSRLLLFHSIIILSTCHPFSWSKKAPSALASCSYSR